MDDHKFSLNKNVIEIDTFGNMSLPVYFTQVCVIRKKGYQICRLFNSLKFTSYYKISPILGFLGGQTWMNISPKSWGRGYLGPMEGGYG